MAISVDGKGPSFEIGAVKPLFDARPVGNIFPPGYSYDVSATASASSLTPPLSKRPPPPSSLLSLTDYAAKEMTLIAVAALARTKPSRRSGRGVGEVITPGTPA